MCVVKVGVCGGFGSVVTFLMCGDVVESRFVCVKVLGVVRFWVW